MTHQPFRASKIAKTPATKISALTLHDRIEALDRAQKIIITSPISSITIP